MKVIITYTNGTQKIENAENFSQALDINFKYTKQNKKDKTIKAIEYKE